ncbi:hypothetical protein OIB37_21245 [Streptomyces sp. NBC_00820]|uniref:hypothetical protein n=1 Tax=Streptomyces sp. NBC_00820 TaxID=2975842 RepID=UPI002ED0413D|nr:hypothetical protein OIB37_21245 [Streptomyces sp. NBC_00820]
MTRHWIRSARSAMGAALVTVAVGVAAAGCSDGAGSSSGTASRAASAAASAASSLASRASDALASATAEAGRRLDEVKNGVNAKDDVSLGAVGTDDAGRSAVGVLARNTTDSAKSFVVQVNYRDGNGHLLDVVVVTVKDVAAGASGEATARSHRKLDGDVRASVSTALRH